MIWDTYHQPASLDEALALLARYGADCRLIAGGTDLILEMERGVRPQRMLVDISHLRDLSRVDVAGETLSLGALVTHNQVVASTEAVARAFPLARACWLVGAPQIRNRGTVAGNLVTASPANDTITPLWAMDGRIVLASQARGERVLSCSEFFLGVRRTALAPDEMLVRIEVPLLSGGERGTFLKFGLRQAQAISVVNVAATLQLAPGGSIRRARIALGSVAPTIIRAPEAEALLLGQEPSREAFRGSGARRCCRRPADRRYPRHRRVSPADDRGARAPRSTAAERGQRGSRLARCTGASVGPRRRAPTCHRRQPSHG